MTRMTVGVRNFLNAPNNGQITVAARPETWVYGRPLAGTRGFESRRGHGRLSVVNVVCCQVEVSAAER